MPVPDGSWFRSTSEVQGYVEPDPKGCGTCPVQNGKHPPSGKSALNTLSSRSWTFCPERGVDVMTQTASFKPMTPQVVSLNYYLENLPASGASGLLYMIIERPRNFKYTIRAQCFDEFLDKREATVGRERV
jgi:hypothetical protein